MSANEAIRMAQVSGIRLGVEGTDLILDADLEPPDDVVSAIKRYKAEIVELIGASVDEWPAAEWRAFFDERAGIAELDNGQTREQANATAFECCVIEWLNRNHVSSDPDRCAWCEMPDTDGHTIVPFGTETHGHVWLHPVCWPDWTASRRKMATVALARIGIRPAKLSNENLS